MLRLILHSVIATSLLLPPAASFAAEAEALWTGQVRPLLDLHCVKCHGPLEQKSGLVLDSLEGLQKGGKEGPVIVPGQPQESRLWKYLAPDSDPHMPPKKQLTPTEQDAFKQWITAMGAAPDTKVTVPTNAAERLPTEPAAVIDHFLATAWKRKSVTPAPLADDRTFARRLWLDLAGRTPTLDELQEFVFSSEPDKRARLADRLLDSRDFARNMREIWDVLLMGRGREGRTRQRREKGWHDFLERSFAENRPWSETISKIIAARPDKPEDKGAVWFLYERKNDHQAIAEALAPVIYGTQINCAQCHDHPLAREIKQAHYWGLVAAFNRSKNSEGGQPAVLESAIGGFINFTNLKKESQPAVMAMLSGQVIAEDRPPSGSKEEDAPDKYVQPEGQPKFPKFSRRSALAQAATESNTLLAKAFVNRLWSQFFGRGLINPVDEMNSRNPASHPELLDWLAQDFAASGFNVRRAIRNLVLSQAYQRDGWRAGAAPPEQDQFAAAAERPLTAEALARSFATTLGRTDQVDALEKELVSRFPDVQPRDYNATTQQSMFLTNSPLVADLLKPTPNGAMAAVLAHPTPELRIRELFLRLLGRRPDSEEAIRAADFLRGKPGQEESALMQLAWALLTCPEFLLNH